MKYEKDLRDLIAKTEWFSRALQSVKSLGLESWCIGAGAIRNMVWDSMHGYAPLTNQSDIDVAYFNGADLSHVDDALQARLHALDPRHKWEVTNQAAVHLWFEGYFGHPVRPLHSLHDAVSTWPEFSTSVAVSLSPEGRLELIAPYGLDDLFELRVRRNPARVSVETYRSRVASKEYIKRWPRVQIFEQ